MNKCTSNFNVLPSHLPIKLKHFFVENSNFFVRRIITYFDKIIIPLEQMFVKCFLNKCSFLLVLDLQAGEWYSRFTHCFGLRGVIRDFKLWSVRNLLFFVNFRFYHSDSFIDDFCFGCSEFFRTLL